MRDRIAPLSPSGEVLLPPNPRRTHGRTGRAALTAGTLSTERHAVDGVAANPSILDADADTLYGDGVESQGNASTEVTGPALPFTSAARAYANHPFWTRDALTDHSPREGYDEAEAVRQSRLRIWQAIR